MQGPAHSVLHLRRSFPATEPGPGRRK